VVGDIGIPAEAANTNLHENTRAPARRQAAELASALNTQWPLRVLCALPAAPAEMRARGRVLVQVGIGRFRRMPYRPPLFAAQGAARQQQMSGFLRKKMTVNTAVTTTAPSGWPVSPERPLARQSPPPADHSRLDIWA